MRKLGRSNSDSLELLLDTVCSMFGAIVLIAILVALLAQTAKVMPASAQASAEMVQRRIATAEADLAQLTALLKPLVVSAGDPTAALAAEKRQLEQALAAARGKQEQMKGQIQEQAAKETVDYGSESKKLSAELRNLERHRAELLNAIKTQQENRARLEGRAAEISKLIQREKDARVVTLRFPKERAQTKESFPIIFKYGKIFPLLDETGERNKRSIAWKSDDGDGHVSLTIETAGWDFKADRASVQNLLGKISARDYYLSLYVYPDSFSAFQSFRDYAAGSGWDFGIKLVRPSVTLIWGSKGTTPPPL
jgi:hypothetical protein